MVAAPLFGFCALFAPAGLRAASRRAPPPLGRLPFARPVLRNGCPLSHGRDGACPPRSSPLVASSHRARQAQSASEPGSSYRASVQSPAAASSLSAAAACARPFAPCPPLPRESVQEARPRPADWRCRTSRQHLLGFTTFLSRPRPPARMVPACSRLSCPPLTSALACSASRAVFDACGGFSAELRQATSSLFTRSSTRESSKEIHSW